LSRLDLPPSQKAQELFAACQRYLDGPATKLVKDYFPFILKATEKGSVDDQSRDLMDLGLKKWEQEDEKAHKDISAAFAVYHNEFFK
jgi:hypothetical protein